MDLTKEILDHPDQRNQINSKIESPNSKHSEFEVLTVWKQWKTSGLMNVNLQFIDRLCAKTQHLLSITDGNSTESCASESLSKEQITNANQWIQIGEQVEKLVYKIGDTAVESQQKFILDTCEKLKQDLQLTFAKQFDSFCHSIKQMAHENGLAQINPHNICTEKLVNPISNLAQTQLNALIDEEFGLAFQKLSAVTFTKLASEVVDQLIGNVVDELDSVHHNLLDTIKKDAVRNKTILKDYNQTESDKSAREEWHELRSQVLVSHNDATKTTISTSADLGISSEELQCVNMIEALHQPVPGNKKLVDNKFESKAIYENKGLNSTRLSQSKEESESDKTPADVNSPSIVPTKRRTKALLTSDGKTSEPIELSKSPSSSKTEDLTDFSSTIPAPSESSTDDSLPKFHLDSNLNHLGIARPKRKRNNVPKLVDKAHLSVPVDYNVDDELFKLNELTSHIVTPSTNSSKSCLPSSIETKVTENTDEDAAPPNPTATRKPDMLRPHGLPGMTGLGSSAMLAELKKKQKLRQDRDAPVESTDPESGNSDAPTVTDDSNLIAPPPKPRKPPLKLPK